MDPSTPSAAATFKTPGEYQTLQGGTDAACLSPVSSQE